MEIQIQIVDKDSLGYIDNRGDYYTSNVLEHIISDEESEFTFIGVAEGGIDLYMLELKNIPNFLKRIKIELAKQRDISKLIEDKTESQRNLESLLAFLTAVINSKNYYWQSDVILAKIKVGNQDPLQIDFDFDENLVVYEEESTIEVGDIHSKEMMDNFTLLGLHDIAVTTLRNVEQRDYLTVYGRINESVERNLQEEIKDILKEFTEKERNMVDTVLKIQNGLEDDIYFENGEPNHLYYEALEHLKLAIEGVQGSVVDVKKKLVTRETVNLTVYQTVNNIISSYSKT